MKKLLLLCFISILSADDLRTFLITAKEHNDLLKASKLEVNVKKKELQSTKNSYYPTLDLAGFYIREDKATPFQPGTVYGAAAEVNWEVYQGGKRSYESHAIKQEVSSKKYTYQANYKEIALAITKDFFNIKSLEAKLRAQQDAQHAINAQLERIHEFYDAKLATSDAIDRLQAAFDKSTFAIESLKFEILTLYKSLELKVGKKITKLDKSEFLKEKPIHSDPFDTISALKSTKSALEYTKDVIGSYYMPHIFIKDRFSFYGYQDTPVFDMPPLPPVPIEYLDNQNRIEATLSLRLFDFGVLREKQEAILLQARALQNRIDFQTKEQRMQQELAKERIKTALLHLKSAKSALKAASSALETITQKYNNAIVDNVIYLDALKTHTEARSAYEQAKNDIEIAYAILYYYHAQNLEELLR